jgi:phytoene desaturase
MTSFIDLSDFAHSFIAVCLITIPKKIAFLNMDSQKVALVLGAGVSGLAVSIRLAAMGFAVKVFEANDFPGGKLSEIHLGKYRFDAGPSLFTMPHLVEELFWLSGKTASSFHYKKLDEVCRYFFPDGDRFTASANKSELVNTLSEKLGENPTTLQKYLDRGKWKYETIGKLFLEKCLRKPSTFLNKRALQAYAGLPKLGLMENLNQYHSSIFSNPKTIQLFNRYATYNGSDPYQTPAVMSMIPHLEFGIGAFFPEKGMYQIADSLYHLALEKGVEFHFSSPVEKLENQNGKITGLQTKGTFFRGDVFVSAIDVSQTYSRLLNMKNLGNQYVKLPKSTSAIIWYWGIKRKTGQTGLHNIFFSSNYKAEFDSLFTKKEMSEDPTIYLNISAKERPEDAPEFGENWFVMVNAPANEGQDWDLWRKKTREKVLARLSKVLDFDIEKELEAETFLDPIALEKRTGAIGGALYGSNSNDRFAAFLRHANFSRQISNLFFCGGTVHPGGGIPLALQSAAIASEYVSDSGI